jgi:hypothetical protein
VIRKVTIVVVMFGAANAAEAQRPEREHEPRWTFGATLGGFLLGNSRAVKQWLRKNSYGADESPSCTFNPLLTQTCVRGDPFPRISGSSIVSQAGSVGLRLTDHVLIETTIAGEQSGTALGHCNGSIVPKDPRCTDQYVELDFSAISLASLAVLEVRRLHVGAGPAILLADWRMRPNALPGVWMDATYRVRSPFFARLQYRVYRSAELLDRGFTRLHPSALFVGAGFMTSPNNR